MISTRRGTWGVGLSRMTAVPRRGRDRSPNPPRPALFRRLFRTSGTSRRRRTPRRRRPVVAAEEEVPRAVGGGRSGEDEPRSEEHTSELQSLMRTSYAVFCLKKKTNTQHT